MASLTGTPTLVVQMTAATAATVAMRAQGKLTTCEERYRARKTSATPVLDSFAYLTHVAHVDATMAAALADCLPATWQSRIGRAPG